MKHKAIFILCLSLMMMTLRYSVVAQDMMYWSGIQVKNQSAETATLQILFYNQDGTIAAQFSNVSLAPQDSKTFSNLDPANPNNPDGVGVDSNFRGSVAVRADKPVVAIVNTMADNLNFGGSSGSFAQGAQEVVLPLIMRNNYGYYTWFNVQNTSLTEVAVISVAYTAGSVGNDLTLPPVTIEPGASHTFDQSDALHNPLADETMARFVGAAKVSSVGGAIAATAVEVGPTTLFAYNGFMQGSRWPLMPLAQYNNACDPGELGIVSGCGYVTGIQIMNIGTEETTVTVSYTPSKFGVSTVEQKTIAPGKSATFNRPESNQPYGFSRFVGGAAVTGNTTSQPLVVVVNQLNKGDNKGAAYSAFDPGAATSTVELPLIMDRNFNYFTGFSVINATDSATTLTYSCTGTDGAAYAAVLNADPVYTQLSGKAAATPVQNRRIAEYYKGACSVTASGGAENRILAIVNELNLSNTGDALLVYEGFNR